MVIIIIIIKVGTIGEESQGGGGEIRTFHVSPFTSSLRLKNAVSSTCSTGTPSLALTLAAERIASGDAECF